MCSYTSRELCFHIDCKTEDCGLRDWTDGPTEAQKVEHLGTHVGTVG